MSAIRPVNALLNPIEDLEREARDLIASAELAEECPEHSQELDSRAEAFGFRLSAFELIPRLAGPHDGGDAFLHVEAGAGGERAAWAGMLLRQYVRWAERMGFMVEWIDGEPGLHPDGHDDGLLRVAGPFAFGLLRGEAGTHRLVRIPPPGDGRRQTTFATVDVVPDGEHPALVPGELMRQTFRTGGGSPYS